MCLCARMLALEWKWKSFYRKNELQIVLLISGGHIGGQFLSTNMASPYKGAWNVSANNSETVGHKNLRFGQIVCILVFYSISFSWLLPLDGFKCICLCRVYCVTVKTKNSWALTILLGRSFSMSIYEPTKYVWNYKTWICTYTDMK